MEKRLTDEQLARIAEAKQRTIERNDEEIVRAWHQVGLDPPRLSDGRPISIELHRMLCGADPTSQAAE